MKLNSNRNMRNRFFSALIIIGINTTAVLGWAPGSEPIRAQEQQEQKPEKTQREGGTADQKPAADNQGRPITDTERQALRREDSSEAEAAVLPYINNFFATTRLGPEDMITVDVFDQPTYSRGNIVVPPNGRINYPLIGKIMIAGRTTDEIEQEIAQKLSEYIIDPKVTVQIVQIRSSKYMVIGDVGVPGVYEMTRRMTVIEALAKAGYVTKYGDRKNISVLRMQPNGQAMSMKVNLKELEKGKAQDSYLVPGDTIVVPGNIFKTIDQVLGLASVMAWMRVTFR